MAENRSFKWIIPTLVLIALCLAALLLWPQLAVAFALILIVYHTVRYLRGLPEGKASFWRKSWQWLKDLLDTLWGIG